MDGALPGTAQRRAKRDDPWSLRIFDEDEDGPDTRDE
jgi:hypothetical protein